MTGACCSRPLSAASSRVSPAGCCGRWLGEQERTAAELMDVVMWGKEPIGGPFTLIDHDGKLRTDADFRGKLLLVYFGFTACADACPTDLAAMAGAVDKLGPAGDACSRCSSPSIRNWTRRSSSRPTLRCFIPG